MPRGGKREGAGRAPNDDSGAGKNMTLRLAPAVRARLDAVCELFDVGAGQVLLWGVESAERNVERIERAAAKKRG